MGSEMCIRDRQYAEAAIPPISQPMHCASGTGRAHTLAIWVAFGGVPGNPSRRDLPPTAPAGHGTLPTTSAGPIASELARHCAAHCPPCRQPQWAILGSLGRSRGVLSIPPSCEDGDQIAVPAGSCTNSTPTLILTCDKTALAEYNLSSKAESRLPCRNGGGPGIRDRRAVGTPAQPRSSPELVVRFSHGRTSAVSFLL